jgi:hypothetical protein
MRFLQISLTNKCNIGCEYCPVKPWRNGRSTLNNLRLIPFIYKNCDPYGTVIELTGGEPGLYNEIDYLIQWLASHRYHGLVKTNGTYPILQKKEFPLIAAFHNLHAPPKFYDMLLIIEGTPDFELKLRYCEEKGIPCKTICFGNEMPKPQSDFINEISFINPDGMVHPCKGEACDETRNRHKQRLHDVDYSCGEWRKPCPSCKPIIDAEKFLDISNLKWRAGQWNRQR